MITHNSSFVGESSVNRQTMSTVGLEMSIEGFESLEEAVMWWRTLGSVIPAAWEGNDKRLGDLFGLRHASLAA